MSDEQPALDRRGVSLEQRIEALEGAMAKVLDLVAQLVPEPEADPVAAGFARYRARRKEGR